MPVVGGTSTTRLDPLLVHQTVERLAERIRARFPERGLNLVAEQLAQISQDVGSSAPGLRRRLLATSWFARIIGAVVLAATSVLLVVTIRDAIQHGPDQSFEWVPLIESLINDLVFAGIALFFLMALPERIQRRELLATLHRLRSLAHIVDMQAQLIAVAPHPDLLPELLSLCARTQIDFTKLTREVSPPDMDSVMAARRCGQDGDSRLPVVRFP